MHIVSHVRYCNGLYGFQCVTASHRKISKYTKLMNGAEYALLGVRDVYTSAAEYVYGKIERGKWENFPTLPYRVVELDMRWMKCESHVSVVNKSSQRGLLNETWLHRREWELLSAGKVLYIFTDDFPSLLSHALFSSFIIYIVMIDRCKKKLRTDTYSKTIIKTEFLVNRQMIIKTGWHILDSLWSIFYYDSVQHHMFISLEAVQHFSNKVRWWIC